MVVENGVTAAPAVMDTGKNPYNPPPYYSKSFRIFCGTIAGMLATALVHPLDLLKCRIQLEPCKCSTKRMARHIICSEGFAGLYNGFSAGILRQATNTSTRLIVYAWLYDNYMRNKVKVDGKCQDPKLSICGKVQYGIYAGIAGALAGNPSEVALIRMMAVNAPVQRSCHYCPYHCCVVYDEECPRKPYKNALDAVRRIALEEGPKGLWRGALLNMGRSVVISIIQISTYARVREILFKRKIGKDYSLHTYTALISSFLAAAMSLPIDMIKTRYQVRRCGVTEQGIIKDIMKKRGVLCFWRGFVPYFVRMFIHTIVAYTILNELSLLYHGDVEEEQRIRNARPWYKKVLSK